MKKSWFYLISLMAVLAGGCELENAPVFLCKSDEILCRPDADGVKVYNCVDGVWQKSEKNEQPIGCTISCDEFPVHSHFLTENPCDWECNEGFDKKLNVCCQKPENSYYKNGDSCDWECDISFHKNSNENGCEPNSDSDCGVLHSNCTIETSDNFRGICDVDLGICLLKCNEGFDRQRDVCCQKPENSHYSNDESCDWKCNESFDKQLNVCCQKPENSHYSNDASCDWECNESFDKQLHKCCQKPENSHYINEENCDWECDSEYYKDGNSCVLKCTPNAVKCENGQYQTCGSDGKWSAKTDCPHSNMCRDSTTCCDCTPGETVCRPQDNASGEKGLWTCQPNGTWRRTCDGASCVIDCGTWSCSSC